MASSEDGADLFLYADGETIAKRGRKGTAEAGTWVSLSPEWMVRDVGKVIEVTRTPLRYFVANVIESETDAVSALTKRGVPRGIALEAVEAAKARPTWPDVYVPLISEVERSALVIAAIGGQLYSYGARVGEDVVFDTRKEAEAEMETLADERDPERRAGGPPQWRVFGFAEAGISVEPPTTYTIQ